MTGESEAKLPAHPQPAGGEETAARAPRATATETATAAAPALEADHPDNLPTGASDDSALGSESASVRSASITSSISGYKYENGRRYHAYREGAYYLPNDEAEQARLDLVHHIWRLAQDGALLAAPPPRRDIERAFDFGTGTGIWAIDFADEHPEAEVIGTDLSPIQPTWVPPNLRFYVDDVEGDWAYREDEAFDLVHGRGMVGAIADWPRLFRQIRANMRPGGVFEMQEYEGWVFSNKDFTNTNLHKWQSLVNEASSKFGKVLDMARKLKPLMEESGFVDVREQIVKIPIGPWAKGKRNKEMGMFQREHICDCVDSYTMGLFTRVLGWTSEECQVMMAKVKQEVRDPQYQLYTNFFFVHGKVPDE